MTTPTRNDLVRHIFHPSESTNGGATTFTWQPINLRRPRGNAPDGIHHATCNVCSGTVTVAVMSEEGLAAVKRRKRSTGLAMILIPAAAWVAGSWTEWFDRNEPALFTITVILTVLGALVGAAMLLKARAFDGITTADPVHHIANMSLEPRVCDRCGHEERLPTTIDIRTFQQELLDVKMRFSTHVCGEARPSSY